MKIFQTLQNLFSKKTSQSGKETEQLVPVFIPALVALLARAEELKGSALNEGEVLRIRDKATCVTVPRSLSLSMDETRGYADIAAENAWNEWQTFKQSIDD